MLTAQTLACEWCLPRGVECALRRHKSRSVDADCGNTTVDFDPEKVTVYFSCFYYRKTSRKIYLENGTIKCVFWTKGKLI